MASPPPKPKEPNHGVSASLPKFFFDGPLFQVGVIVSRRKKKSASPFRHPVQGCLHKFTAPAVPPGHLIPSPTRTPAAEPTKRRARLGGQGEDLRSPGDREATLLKMDGTGSLTVFTNDKGGAIDDSVVTKVNDHHVYLVVNAGCRDKDLAHIGAHMEAFQKKGGDVKWHVHDERSLLALQTPKSRDFFFHLAACYTGEDGFEISVPSENAVDLAKALLEKSEGKVRLTGLGARDSLRLEAGLCLYGNDMEQHITPVEAGLSWAIGKRRKAEGGFLGADVILKQLKEGPKIRRVGIFSQGPPPRSHSEIVSGTGENIGEVTSGGFSPCLKKNIAMGYVKNGLHKAGTEFKVVVRGKQYDAVVTKMPFVPTKYYKAP
ncbi:Aminomethyltransferase, mitochondrial [Triticum urartu]|uniref:Aminomethyltransferase, mitochondrial n=1 Tax=Triticum urartu TaxID=4572 RepID=M7YGC6_TRIUA|nr:Aminomethyltransferase, mitochondrial [Triticum urartu]